MSQGRDVRAHARVVIGILALALTMVGAVATHVQDRVEGQLTRIEGVFTGLADRPAAPAPDSAGRRPMTILALGLDGERAPERWRPGLRRSDVIMVVHVSADRSTVTAVSIPRDSWVAVPGHGHQKMNAAYSLGGPSVAVATVEQLTGLRIDHLAVVDWSGLAELTEQLGGVTVEVAQDTEDTMWDRTWEAGPHRLDGKEASAYLRQRYGLPDGDLDRIRRQQHFLGRILAELTEVNSWEAPGIVLDLGALVAGHTSIDEGWSLGEIQSLALSLRSLESADVQFVTAPVAGLGREGEQSVVRLDPVAGDELWRSLRAGRISAWAAHHPEHLLSDQVR